MRIRRLKDLRVANDEELPELSFIDDESLVFTDEGSETSSVSSINRQSP